VTVAAGDLPALAVLEEVDHFNTMLDTAKKHVSDAEIAALIHVDPGVPAQD
jgi:hypothetical protein